MLRQCRELLSWCITIACSDCLRYPDVIAEIAIETTVTLPLHGGAILDGACRKRYAHVSFVFGKICLEIMYQ